MLQRASVPFPIVLVRFTGRGNVVGDLRPAGMLMGQGVARVMPEPETCAPAACAKVRGAATVMAARPGAPLPPLPPKEATETTAVSWLAPLSIVMACPALKPIAFATVITVAEAPIVVAPAVPTDAMTAVSGRGE